MWWRRLVAGCAAAALGAVTAGCGFSPLYGEGKGVRAGLGRVHVDGIADRTGQRLRNALLVSLPPGRGAEPPAYRLKITLEEEKQRLGVEKHDVATRSNLVLTAHYVIEDMADGKVLISGRVASTNSYNIVQSPYGALAAEKNARARAVRQLADGITARLAAWLSARR